MLSLVLALLASPHDVARPAPTPTRFASDNYGVAATLPGGLFYCPILPDLSVAPDHGFMAYLSRPRSCVTAATAPADAPPALFLFYAYAPDLSPEPGSGGTEVPPPLRLARLQCAHGGKARLAQISVAGLPTGECRRTVHGRVALSLIALYSPGPGHGDAEISVDLLTTPAREAADRLRLKELARGVRLCRVSDAPADPTRPDCATLGSRW